MKFASMLRRLRNVQGGMGSTAGSGSTPYDPYTDPPPDDPFGVTVAANPQTVALGTAVTFEGTVSNAPDGANLSYSWDFSDEANPTAGGSGVRVSYTYPTTGVKTASLTVSYTDTNGDLVEASDNLKVTVVFIKPKTVNDGGSVDFEVLGAESATAFSWGWRLPSDLGLNPEVGNNPEVVFSPPDSRETTINNAHWYAYPNQACSDRIEDAAETSSEYEIFCNITFPDGRSFTATSTLTVDVPWALGGSGLSAGSVDVDFVGDPTITQISEDPPLWKITGKGTLERVVSKTINVPVSSQFHDKIDVHEQVHVRQLETGGIASSFYTLDDFFTNHLIGLTHSDLTFLKVLSIPNALGDFKKAENKRLQSDEHRDLRDQMEVEAYAASDTEPPQYIYQNCGRYE